MSKDRERELVSKVSEGHHNEYTKAFVELFTLRLERHKNTLVSIPCEVTRGRAQEARDVLKFFER